MFQINAISAILQMKIFCYFITNFMDGTYGFYVFTNICKLIKRHDPIMSIMKISNDRTGFFNDLRLST